MSCVVEIGVNVDFQTDLSFLIHFAEPPGPDLDAPWQAFVFESETDCVCLSAGKIAQFLNHAEHKQDGCIRPNAYPRIALFELQ